MPNKLGPGEPPAGPWQVVPIGELVRMVFDAGRSCRDRPWIVAVDGRSGSGKSTLAALLHASVPASAVVHTDDVAWHHSFFDWSELLVAGVLKPLRHGHGVRYRPPGWDTHARPGAIEVAAGLDLVVVEGVGAGRTELMEWIDRSVWVQSDFDEAERRGIARDGGTDEARRFWHTWMVEEIAFVQQQRPWERAAVIVNGTPAQPDHRSAEVVVARGVSYSNSRKA